MAIFNMEKVNKFLASKQPEEVHETKQKVPTFKRYQIAFNKNKDADIIELLDKCENKTELIRYLLREFYKYVEKEEGR